MKFSPYPRALCLAMSLSACAPIPVMAQFEFHPAEDSFDDVPDNVDDTVEPVTGGINLMPLHPDCPTYVMRGSKLGQAKKAVRITMDDTIVAGTTVISMSAPE